MNEKSLEQLNDYLKTNLSELSLFPEDIKMKFLDFNEFYEFVKKEVDFWKDLKTGEISKIDINFQTISNELQKCNNVADNDINQAIRFLASAIEYIKKRDFPCIFSRTQFGMMLREKYKEHSDIAEGIIYYKFNTKKRFIDITPRINVLIGILFAYIQEKAAKDISSSIAQTETSLKDIYQEYQNKLYEIKSLFKDETNRIAQEANDFTTKTENWRKDTEKSMQDLIDEKRKKLEEQEKLYTEKLRLEGPADYWRKFRDSYRKGGVIWLVLGILMGAAVIGLCFILIYNMPEKIFAGEKLSIENTIRWTIIFALGFSTSIYLLRLFVKLCLSDFHLSRDANERLQLTHLYLSLLKENAIEEKNREILLQSLFSRAETGLLKGDSSPTLPTGGLEQIISNFKQ